MASTPAAPPKEALDVTIPAKPFAQASHWLLRAKPQPERPKSNSVLFYEDRCDICLDLLFDNRTLPQQKIKAAIELGGLIGKIEDADMAHNSIYILREMMIDDSEHSSVRMVCAVSLGSSGYKGLVEDMEKEVLKSNASVQSKLLSLKALSICRSEEAIELLGNVALYGDVDQICIAAARELLNIPLFPAQKIVNQVLSHPPEAYLRNPDFMAEFRRLAGGCYLPTN
ncbi:hypothetical protein H0O01_01630 [Candidatus Micrarchaeota archaeon]|nr:hypothetical protein [Candidatus Micrarchaeota archaeon]